MNNAVIKSPEWTHEAIIALAIAFDLYRLEVIPACGGHDVLALPTATDSQVPYCQHCFSLFSPAGVIEPAARALHFEPEALLC